MDNDLLVIGMLLQMLLQNVMVENVSEVREERPVEIFLLLWVWNAGETQCSNYCWGSPVSSRWPQQCGIQRQGGHWHSKPKYTDAALYQCTPVPSPQMKKVLGIDGVWPVPQNAVCWRLSPTFSCCARLLFHSLRLPTANTECCFTPRLITLFD